MSPRELPYVVHAWDYSHRSAGLRALYRLTEELRNRGKQAVISSLGPSCWPVEEPPIELGELNDPEAIHVYPELINGNPANAWNVVRWLLGPKRYPSNDLEFAWNPDIDDAPRLVVDIIEPELFYPKETPGSGTLWWCGSKGRITKVPDNAREITYDWPATRQDLADVLRGADLLVSFDSFTALTQEAVVCGTPVLIPDGVPIVESRLFGRCGIAYGESELEQARAEVQFAADQHELTRQELAHDIDRFIEITSAHFGG